MGKKPGLSAIPHRSLETERRAETLLPRLNVHSGFPVRNQ